MYIKDKGDKQIKRDTQREVEQKGRNKKDLERLSTNNLYKLLIDDFFNKN